MRQLTPQQVILYSCAEAWDYGSLARAEPLGSDANILAVMPLEGRS